MTTSQQQASADRLRVAAVQMHFAPTIKQNLVSIHEALTDADRRRADVVLFPECAVTGYTYDFDALTRKQIRDALTGVSRMAAEHQINVLVGSPVFRGRKLCNCLVLFDRSGQVKYCYAKCHLTQRDTRWFTAGNAVAFFDVDGVCATTIICHERRYPELVRLAVMAGARIVFHPNAGLDTLAVSRRKRDGRDGIAVRAFENAVYYVFANSVGPQGKGKWSAGDSKIVAPDGRVLKLADNQTQAVLVANLDLTKATGVYATGSLQHPRFLRPYWMPMLRELRRRAGQATGSFSLPHTGDQGSAPK